jgi:hypothetical protein
MYGEWGMGNILMMFHVYLVQGFRSEHGPVKVGELEYFSLLAFTEKVLCPRWF